MKSFKSKNKPKFTPELLKQVVDMVKARRQLSEISELTGLREKTIINKLGLLGHSFKGLTGKNSSTKQ